MNEYSQSIKELISFAIDLNVLQLNLQKKNVSELLYHLLSSLLISASKYSLNNYSKFWFNLQSFIITFNCLLKTNYDSLSVSGCNLTQFDLHICFCFVCTSLAFQNSSSNCIHKHGPNIQVSFLILVDFFFLQISVLCLLFCFLQFE